MQSDNQLPKYKIHYHQHHHHHYFWENGELLLYFPLVICFFGVAEAAARVGIFKHFDLLQLAAIPPVEFQDETRV